MTRTKDKLASPPLTAAEYLRRPYMRVVVPEVDESFRAEILEFPGCIATGETQEEALTALSRTAESWIDAALALGQSIPEPLEETDFSGKLVVRMPKSLHRKAALAAERDGVSLNQFIIGSIAQLVGERSTQPREQRATSSNVQILQSATSTNVFWHNHTLDDRQSGQLKRYGLERFNA